MVRFDTYRWVTLACAAVCILAARPSDFSKFGSPFMTAASSEAGPPAHGYATLALANGDFYTGEPTRPRAKFVAITGETIAAVTNSATDWKLWIGPQTRVVDLHGQFAMPGFNDAHVHMASAGFGKLEINLEGTKSLAELQERIRSRLKDFKPGEWITGRGWDHTLWPEKVFPTRQELDSVSADHPMLFYRMDGHVAIANSRALQIAGIARSTQDPPAGHIVRDPKSGDATGLLEEDSAMSLVALHVPPPSREQRRHALELAIDEAAQFGVTSVQDNSVQSTADGSATGWDNFIVYQQLKRAGKLKIRITEWLPFDAPLTWLEERRRASGGSSAQDPGDPWLKTGALKAFMDGSLGSRTAALLVPYSDEPSTSGILRVVPAKLTAMAIDRDRAGFQLAFHAIGDRANRVALDTYAAVLAADGPRDRRDRIEHAQIVAPEDIPRFAELHVIASMQPSHLLDDERWAEDRLGAQRLRGAYAWHSMLQARAPLAFGTDYPVESINPLRGIYACVTRELPGGGPTGGWQPQEKLTMDECLRAYTAGAAYAQFEEHRKGKLAAGMFADIVVYPVDITKIPPRELLSTRVAMTISGGRVTYEQH
jgi:predicted amidohydrolase YtcJ